MSFIPADILLQIESHATGIGVGGVRQGLLCPFCIGGTSGRDYSFSIGVDEPGKIWYKCHRASCSRKGVHSLKVQALVAVPNSFSIRSEAAPKAFIYNRRLENFDAEKMSQLTSEWHLTEEEIKRAGWRWAVEDGKIFIPLKNEDFSVYGYVLRRFPGDKDGMKSSTHPYNTYIPILGWHKKGGSKSMIIVEDLVSAARASTYLTAVALCGTTFSFDKVRAIQREVDLMGYDRVYLALDSDALEKALEYIKSYRTFLPMFLVVLEKDIKNQKRAELFELFQELQIYPDEVINDGEAIKTIPVYSGA